jgi:hypothetical protein
MKATNTADRFVIIRAVEPREDALTGFPVSGKFQP